MHDLILWCGFLGAWLLVAGPVYQAVLELNEEDAEVDRLRELFASADPPPRLSRWWWLLPPVRIVLARRLRDRWQADFMAGLSAEDRRVVRTYVNTAMGWLLVGAGGSLIAVKETYELVEGHEWPLWVFAALVVLGLVASLGHAALRSGHDRAEDARAEVRRTPS